MRKRGANLTLNTYSAQSGELQKGEFYMISGQTVFSAEMALYLLVS